MPEARLARTRQLYLAWRRPSANAAEQLHRRAGWNVIEGDHHDAPPPSPANAFDTDRDPGDER